MWLRSLCFGLASVFTLSNVNPAAARELACGDTATDLSRIVVAGGSLAEILYALDKSETLVAADTTSNYPEAANALPKIGYVRNLSAEGLLSLKPSFVLGEDDMGPPEVVAQLKSLGIEMLVVPEKFDADGIQQKVRCVAAAVGAGDAGEALNKRLMAGVADRSVQDAAAPRGLVLLGLREGAPVAAGINTSGDGLLTMAGAQNLLRFEGWKPVSIEALAAASPEFIVIPERGVAMAGGLDKLLEHPALRLTPAARSRRVITMDGMAMLGFGPRTVQAAATLRETLLGNTEIGTAGDGTQ
jgi:iron complex transport system substrate-binding protein